MMKQLNMHNPRIVTAKSSRFAASQMDWGNLVSLLLPPLTVLWFGASILIYALNKHHPEAKVGRYTQWAAYRFYGVMGLVIPVGTFFPGNGFTPWLIAWGLGVAIIVPWSIWSIVQIYRDSWQDIELPAEQPAEEIIHAESHKT